MGFNKTKEYIPSVDFHEMMDHVQSKYGFDMYDYGEKWAKGQAEKDSAKKKWMSENGYSDVSYVLNKPEGSSKDWPKDSEEMKLRVEINSKFSSSGIEKEIDEKYPYRNFWHHLLDTDFCELSRGGYNLLGLSDLEGDSWTNEIRRMILEEVKENKAFDGETLNCFVDW